MRKFLFAIAIMALIMSFTAFAEGGLIANPDFEQPGSGGIPEDWYRDMWKSDAGVSYLETRDNGVTGACIYIENASPNDARFIQDVVVVPDALYEITCMVKAEGIPEDTIGANISIKNTFSYSDSVYDTHGQWKKLTLYGRTDENQHSLTLCARIGGYSALNTGKAWFDDFEMRVIDALPLGADEMSFATFAPAAAKDDVDEDADAEPPRNTPTWLLAAFGMCIFAIAIARKTPALKLNQRESKFAFWGLIAIAFIVRVVIACTVRGYYTDINCFASWSERMFANGPTGFYNDDYFCDYPPLYMLMLYVPAILRRMLGVAFNSQAHVLLIKLIPIIFDLMLAWLIYRVAHRRMSGKVALILGGVFAINPAAIIDSAAWGQIDSVFTFFTVLSALELSERRYHLALPVITAAILIKPQALLFAPLGLFALVFDLITDPKARENIAKAVIGFAVACAMLMLSALIFAKRGVNPFQWLWQLFSGTMKSYSKLTLNTFNLWQILGYNWADMSDHPYASAAAWTMFALSYLIAFGMYMKRRDHSALFVSGAALIMLVCAFGPMIHERYVYPALALLLTACAIKRDRRLYIPLTILTVTLFMNQILVLQGGMTKANYGHLQSSEAWLNSLMSVITVINALLTAIIAFTKAPASTPDKTDKKPLSAISLLGNRDWRLNLKRVDYLAMAAVTLAYSLLTFTNLGTLTAPETSWVSSAPGESITFDLGSVRTWRMEYFGGICNTTFTVELSNDGEIWTESCRAVYDQGEVFRWLFYVPSNEALKPLTRKTEPTGDGSAYITYKDTETYPRQTARYARITALSSGLILNEIGFLGDDGKPLPVTISAHEGANPERAGDPNLLTDEQDTIPEKPSHLNSTYFDEIYHARTAYEHLHGLHTYEYTHPPLGKVMMMIGIKLFGMCPFGWRFMGALMGVLMLPVMYLMVKQLGGSSKVSFIAMALLALDSMHFTQTRIATIDSYAVFFIMLMYLFMFRYMRMSFYVTGLRRTLVPLMLCGITMGCAWATKWIGLYASAGLAILFFMTLFTRIREHFYAVKRSQRDFDSDEDRRRIENAADYCLPKVLITLGVCVVFFIVIPLIIYYLSYYWHMQYEGGLTIKGVFQTQINMFNYHSGLGGDTHSFRSPWYEWPVIAWPMWYYSGTPYQPGGVISSISCMGNPAVWWTGLAAIITALVLWASKRRPDEDLRTVSIGFLSQYLPWVLVPRSTFIYHYFASVPFIIIATVLLIGRLEKRNKRAFAITAYTLVALAAILFIMFYPLESGTPVSRSYAQLLRWFDWYNF